MGDGGILFVPSMVAAFVALLVRLNRERTAETPWGDAFLRAFTAAAKWAVVVGLAEAAILLVLYAIVTLLH